MQLLVPPTFLTNDAADKHPTFTFTFDMCTFLDMPTENVSAGSEASRSRETTDSSRRRNHSVCIAGECTPG